MTSWYSSILTRTTSQISSLLSSENDGDTEDDTHVCRVLRAYHLEKGRPLPSWLPPDPKAPQPQQLQPMYLPTNMSAAGGASSRYGLGGAGGAGSSAMSSRPATSGGSAGGGGGLSSLWESNAAAAAAAATATAPTGPQPTQQQQPTMTRLARPLPSQRAGSHQGALVGGGASSAQDRLKQRLWGPGRQTPSPAQGGGQFQPPPPSSSSGGAGGYDDRGRQYGAPRSYR